MWILNSIFILTANIFAVTGDKAVICYYFAKAERRTGFGRFTVKNIEPKLCTHAIYAFAGITVQGSTLLNPDLGLSNDEDVLDSYRQFNELKLIDPNLLTLLSVGSNDKEESYRFSVIADDPKRRQYFIKSAIDIAMKNGFNGIDLHWMYSVDGNSYKYFENLATLVKEFKTELKKCNLLFTIAVEGYLYEYNIQVISDAVDIVNAMTFNYKTGREPVTGHNAPLHYNSSLQGSVKNTLKFWMDGGCPAEKLAIGIPFFGRSFLLENQYDNGVGAKSRKIGLQGPYSQTPGFLGYNEICSTFASSPWHISWDSVAGVPYAFSKYDWITYDERSSVAEKVQYARSIGIDKVMVWSIDTDDFMGLCFKNVTYPLLRTAKSGFVYSNFSFI